MSEKIRVIIADDHQILLDGLKMIMSSWEDFEVVGMAANGQIAVELCDTLEPDMALLDMQMPVMTGAEATSIIKSRHPQIKVVALTTFDDAETVMNAMKTGCDGFLLKMIEPEQLRRNLHSIMNGVSTYDERAMAQIRNHMDEKKLPEFSERELQILTYVCRGLTNKEIADELSLRPGTVKNMISVLFTKTYSVSRADLTRYALNNKLVSIDE